MTGQVILATGAKPNPPSPGKVSIYPKADKALYTQDEQGNENRLAVSMTGEMRDCSGANVPDGWMACLGQLLNVADYPALFDVIGATFGGDGVNSFALPNRRQTGAGQRIINVGRTAPYPVVSMPVPAAIHGPIPGYYKAADVLSFSVQLLDDIAVTGGPVKLDIDIGGTAHSLALVSSTATEWVFADYTVQSGDNGEVTATIDLNGATLSSGGIDAVLSTAPMANVTVDTVAPTITFSALALSFDTGTSATDFITKTAAQTISATLSGVLSATERACGSLDNGATWTDITGSVFNTSLSWAVTLTASNTLILKVADLAGNDGTIASQAYVLDTSSPATLTITLATDSGSSGSDGITNVGTINVGNLEAGATWRRSTDGGTTWTAGTGNSFTLAAGTYAAGSIKVEQTDIAGNVSAIGSNAATITVDTTAPAAPTVNALTTANTTPTITGTATVGAGEVLTVVVNSVTYTAGGADLTLAGTDWTLVIPPGDALAVGTYSVTATVTDTAGNATSDNTDNELIITA
jgi:microcystin-dependent protein